MYFNSIVTQTILDNPFILLEKNKFDKETLDKIISEWIEENEESSDIPEKESLTLKFHLDYEHTKEEKKKFFEDLDNIFGCSNLSEDLPSDFLDMDEDFDDWFGKSLEHSKFLDEERHVFKDPDRVFNEINIGKLNYFHLIITIKISWAYSGNLYPYSNFYVYDYLFSKTKGNKYLFKTEFNEKLYRENLCNYE